MAKDKNFLAIIDLRFRIPLYEEEVTLTIRGYRLFPSKFDDAPYKLQPPSYQGGFKWYEVARIENPRLWYALEQEIVAEFERRRKQGPLRKEDSDMEAL